MQKLTTSLPRINSLAKVSGQISHYKKQRTLANFFFTDNNQKIMGLAAIAGGLTGAFGQAAGNVRDAANLHEEADYVEMKVDGQPVKGWVWFSPFSDGDIVEVIGTKKESYFEAIAICRPSDRVISLYPHCSRGKKAHVKSVLKWWVILTGIIIAFIAILDGLINFFSSTQVEYVAQTASFFYAALSIYAISGIFAYVNGRKFMIFVRAATQVFKIIGLENVDNVNLPKLTKRKPGDPGVFGVMYFNY
ncbi:putative type VI secretion system effector [Chromobacterium vaccinii]|uniref:Type VI secretion system effector n=1 Tax=Chromobacterium vaccinii TaxID=1108595 RepID=A0ABV0FD30_9NEIS